MRQYWLKLNASIQFLIKALGLYLVWFLLYDLWLKPNQKLDFAITWIFSKISAFILNLLGIKTNHVIHGHKQYLYSNDKFVIGIADACNGLVLYVIFAALIIILPGPIRAKAKFISLGILSIFILNVIRVIALSLNNIYSPGSLQFNHHYTFTIIVYGYIFWLWYIWVKKTKVTTEHNDQ